MSGRRKPPRTLHAYAEQTAKRTFIGAIEWPGWERSGRDEARAIAAFLEAGPRYRRALGRVAAGLALPDGESALDVVERRPGDVGTEFGVPSMGPTADERPVDDEELDRLRAILGAAWKAFDAAATAAEGVELRKGPRGGGREVGKIVEHVLGAESAYLREIGGRADADPTMADVRDASLRALADRAHGIEVDMGRRKRPFWTPRYFVRRSAWHALDHAWEIEDRSTPEAAS